MSLQELKEQARQLPTSDRFQHNEKLHHPHIPKR
jgi:hypothetical protein